MAEVELRDLSANWKKLQAKLRSSKLDTPSKPAKVDGEKAHSHSLKRKRLPVNGHASSKQPNGKAPITSQKQPLSRKRQKMDEPASVGASVKQHGSKNLSRSASMPSLKKKPLAPSQAASETPTSVIDAHPDFPDIENEGVSEIALPGKYVALDCEMVGIGPEPDRDSALARVSLVNFHGHQVYDSYVQVPRKLEVTDYRTAVSGIEPKHLREDVARPFEEVREDLKVLLAGRILIGHAVKNDLDVLILQHDRRLIRDTSKFSKFRALSLTPGRTPGLKHLAERLLGVEIQTGAHSSVEDARATMALYRLEKDEFENEIRKKYGNVRVEAIAAQVDGGEERTPRKRNNNKKKRKKKY